MSRQIPVVFKNEKDESLFGIFHEPKRELKRSVGIILLSPGVKMRVAPHRMYNKMAEYFVSLGFPVLRFDFYGLGDAEGKIELDQLSDVYNSIQSGRYIGDTRSSLDWMSNEAGISRCIVGGLCGGAITGLLASQDDDRICALLGLGIPVALDVSAVDWSQNLTQGELGQLRRGYVKNLFNPSSWVRLLTFRSNYNVIWKSLKQSLVSLKMARVPKKNAPDDSGAEKDNTNPRFAPAFLNMLKTSRPMLYIFSGSDRLAWEYEEKFVSRYQDTLKQYTDLYTVYTIEKANHVFAHPEWLKEMLTISGRWLEQF